MRICVYGAASNKIEAKYLSDMEQVGQSLAMEGHSLVFGGGDCGMMGAAAKGFYKGNGDIIGVVTNYIKDFEDVFENCSQQIVVDTLAERKLIMEDKADAFLIVPGGIGTYDEFFQCLTLKELKRHNKPILVYNAYGFYDELLEFMEQKVNDQFIRKEVPKMYAVCQNAEEILQEVKKV